MGKRIPKETEIGFLNNVYYLYYAKLISHLIDSIVPCTRHPHDI
jgi:hypothetical protein